MAIVNVEMSREEKFARDLLAVQTAFLHEDITRVCEACGVTPPVLTDEECRAITINYPYTYQTVREAFPVW